MAANKKKNQYTSRNKKFAKILVEQKWKRMNLKIIFTILQICMIFWKMWIQSEREFRKKSDLFYLEICVEMGKNGKKWSNQWIMAHLRESVTLYTNSNLRWNWRFHFRWWWCRGGTLSLLLSSRNGKWRHQGPLSKN